MLLFNPKRAARIFSLAVVVGSLVPLPAFAHQHSSAAVGHAARLARRQANHAARLARQQTQHAAKLAKGRVQSAAKLAKLRERHEALASGNAVAAAYSLRGSRYVLGGTSRSGFDCSGFVRYVLSAADGVALPRTAAEQFYHGHAVAPADMEPGDLVFFKNTYKRGISHVGLYAGNGNFIHAANSHKGVRMDKLSDAYYAAHFAGARRVLPAEMRAASFLR